MKRTLRASILAIVLTVFILSSASAIAANPTPSTNDNNKANGWAYVEVVASGPGTITLQFLSTRSKVVSCFEYRTDGDTSQMTNATNYNTDITDGLYPFKCVNNSAKQVTLLADSYVEVRMVFGGERDERFTWTKFTVPPVPAAPVIGWMWNKSMIKGEELPTGPITTVPHSWEQLMSKGLKIAAADWICWPFREGQFGWTGRIYQLTGETWTPLATTLSWSPNEEGQFRACAKAPSAGTYALFGFWQPD